VTHHEQRHRYVVGIAAVGKGENMMKESIPIGVRSLYTKTYAKHGKTIGQSKNAIAKAYEAVEQKHGKDMLNKLKSFHEANKRGEEPTMKKGGSAKKKHHNW
jgi:predicted GTPase